MVAMNWLRLQEVEGGCDFAYEQLIRTVPREYHGHIRTPRRYTGANLVEHVIQKSSPAGDITELVSSCTGPPMPLEEGSSEVSSLT